MNTRLPASKYDIGTQRIPEIIMILSNPERILFSLLDGFLSAIIPQYIVNGNETIPVQVIKVPRGIDLLSFKAIVSKEEPVAKSIITLKVKIRAL